MDEALAASTETALPAALAEPVRPVRPNWITLLFLANIGLWLAIYAPIQVLLPEQVASLNHHVIKSGGVPSGADAVLLSVVMGVGAIASLLANPVVGALSDRWGRRKPFVIGSAAIMALAAAILSASPTWHMALVAAPLLGAGYGTYWAAAPALLTQVLPAASDRAKDLGLINIAYSLPLVVAPLVAGVVLGLMNSYPALFALASLVTISAAVTVTRVRSVP